MAEQLIRVVTLNVLTPPYATTETFVCNSEIDLNPDRRLQNLCAKLQREMKNDTVDGCVIICLQEVCQDWANYLIAWFENFGYHFVYRLYGPAKSGYMGVGVAYQRAAFGLIDCSVARVADSVTGIVSTACAATESCAAVARPMSCTDLPGWLFNCATNFSLFGSAANAHEPQEANDLLKYIYRKYQCMVLLQLECRRSNRRFYVATCHMPCDWRKPNVMMLHALVLSRCIARNVCDATAPVIFAGDFNSQPGDLAYRALTAPLCDLPSSTGDARLDKLFQVVVQDLKFDFVPFVSAYCQVDGTEPDFTNHARIKWKHGSGQEFQATIDYIFLRNCTAIDVLDLSSIDSTALLPSALLNEPSDHLMLAATIKI